MQNYLIIVISALFLEAAFGYPQWLFRRIGHPVVWIGAGITLLERYVNHTDKPPLVQRLLGALTMASVLAATVLAAMAIQWTDSNVLMIIAATTLFATRSLYDHIYDVYEALSEQGIEAGRERVSRVVGRDVGQLDESGVCRAAIESLAESLSDGVIAPLFWGLLLGLPGLAGYKAINTADSMIGHKDKRYIYFGWAAARLDDIANYIPARISGLMVAFASFSLEPVRFMIEFAHKHASQNAGWPEAAMAGALNVQLGGANSYDGVEYQAAIIGRGASEITLAHLRQALGIYITICIMVWFMLLLALIRT